jgi:predicted transcriptional regulator
LDVANNGSYDHTKKMTTSTMYTTLFNHPKLKAYWELLIQKGLLEYDSDTQKFKTTEKGRELLRIYKTRVNDDMRQ